MISSAVLSACGCYRYSLTRVWDTSRPTLVFIMLNPSTADASVNDPTIMRCIGFARGLLYGGIRVVNLWAYRATSPKDLAAAGWPVGPQNDQYIVDAVAQNPGIAVCGWGREGTKQPARVRQVLDLIDLWTVPVALRLTADGVPWHPLYLPAYSTPVLLQ